VAAPACRVYRYSSARFSLTVRLVFVTGISPPFSPR
jgi:hypothetical protein